MSSTVSCVETRLRGQPFAAKVTHEAMQRENLGAEQICGRDGAPMRAQKRSPGRSLAALWGR